MEEISVVLGQEHFFSTKNAQYSRNETERDTNDR